LFKHKNLSEPQQAIKAQSLVYSITKLTSECPEGDLVWKYM